MISATSDSQDSTDDRLRPEGYDIPKTVPPNENQSDDDENDALNNSDQNRSDGGKSLPGLIIVMPERRIAVASQRT